MKRSRHGCKNCLLPRLRIMCNKDKPRFLRHELINCCLPARSIELARKLACRCQCMMRNLNYGSRPIGDALGLSTSFERFQPARAALRLSPNFFSIFRVLCLYILLCRTLFLMSQKTGHRNNISPHWSLRCLVQVRQVQARRATTLMETLHLAISHAVLAMR